MSRSWLLPLLTFIALGSALVAAAEPPAPRLDRGEIETLRTMLDDAREMLRDDYLPKDRFNADFVQRCREADAQLRQVESYSAGFMLIASTLQTLDPRIYFLPPPRAGRVDYGWNFRVVGQEAYIVQVDRESDAARQGLKPGDKLLAIEGIALQRDTAFAVDYLFHWVSPRGGLRLVVQSPGEEPRELSLASTVRPPRKLHQETRGRSVVLRRVPTASDWQRWQDVQSGGKFVRRFGDVAVWRALALEADLPAIKAGLAEIRGAQSLILDLRGNACYDHEHAELLLDALFTQGFEAGRIDRGRGHPDEKIKVSGSAQALTGTVVVLVDERTSFYAELIARVLQQKQRAVIMGDRTRGRVLEQIVYGAARGAAFNFNVAGLVVPHGEVVLADGSKLDGVGVTPDYLLLPRAEDFAQRRDPVLSRALALLKQKLSPEEAFALLRMPYEDEDDYVE